MHITGGTRYQRLRKLGLLERRWVATNADPTNAQPARNMPNWGEELKWMFIFASSINNVIRTLIRPRGMAITVQTTQASADDLVVAGGLTQSVFIIVSKALFCGRTSGSATGMSVSDDSHRRQNCQSLPNEVACEASYLEIKREKPARSKPKSRPRSKMATGSSSRSPLRCRWWGRRRLLKRLGRRLG